jgi:rubrerythrin
MHEETRINLRAAMRDEAYAHGMCWLSAVRARTAGQAAVADLFERAASAQRDQHFAKLAELSGLAESVEGLLAEAIRLESRINHTDFARQAQAVGDTEAAELLTTIQAFREAQLEALRAARMRLQLVTPELVAEQPPITEAEPSPAPVADTEEAIIDEENLTEEEAPLADDPTAVEEQAESEEQQATEHEPEPSLEEPATGSESAGPPDDPAIGEPESPAGVLPTDRAEVHAPEGSDEAVAATADMAPDPSESRSQPSQTREEYRVVFVDKQTQKSGEGAHELEQRLSDLARDGWRLTSALGSQLILRREAR